MKNFYFAVALLFLQLSSFATHIVGGDITVKYVSGNTFEIKLLFYRDCSAGSAAFDNSVTLGFFDKVTNAQLSTFTLPKTSSAIKPLGDACFTPSLCVEEGIYKANVTLANNINGCYISWQRCCRNATIDNIVNPLNAGMAFYAEIPNPALHNSSPSFGTYPRAYMCHGAVNLENFSATDIDGDQLVYSLVTPLNGNASSSSSNPAPSPGPYPTITWKAPYSLNNIIGSTPNMAINTSTGIVNATPTVIGKFVFAVRVEEFRNGVKIGEIRRDAQYQIINCQNPNIPGASPTLTCAAPTAAVTCGSSVPNVTYSWTGPGIVSGANTPTATVNVGGYYTVVVTQPSGCTNTSYILVNTNTTQPALTVGNPLIINCVSPSGAISASSTTGGVTYSWSGPGIVSGGSTANAIVNTAGTYTVTVTNQANGCTKTGTVSVTGNSIQPNLTAGPHLDLTCALTSSTISASSSTGGVSYNWAGTGIVSGGTTSSPVINAAGTYTVTITNPANSCTKTGTVNVTSNTTQPNLTTGNPLTLTCALTSSTINASSTTGGVNYNWTGAGIVSGGTTSAPTVNVVGTYTVTVTNPANGCSKTGTIAVTNNLTLPNVIPSELPLILTCSTTSGTISVSSTTQGATFNWSGSGIVSGATTAAPTVNSTGAYLVTVTNPANGCTATASIAVTNNLTPPVITSSSALTLTCTATNGVITASSNVGNASYNWVGPGIVSNGNTASPTINAPGTYTVTGTNPANGCTNTLTVSVLQNIIQPTATAGPSITLTCATTSGTISASTNASNPGYSWVGSGIVSGNNSSTPIVNAAGTYTVTIINTTNGCTNTTTVAVNENLIAPNAIAGNTLTLTCATPSSTINVSSTTPNANYNWTGPGVVSGGATASPIVNTIGTYTVVVTDPVNGCTSVANVLVNNNLVAPNLTPGANLVLTCTNTTVSPSASSSTPGVSYSWTGQNIISGNNNSTATVNAAGTYTVTITDPINGCTNTSTVNVAIDNSLPTITTSSDLILNCVSKSGTISASSTNNVNYSWTGPGIVSGNTSTTPTINAAGTYTVVVTDVNTGCQSVATVNATNDIVAPTLVSGNALILNCVVTSDTINVNSSTPNVNYSWTGSGIVSGNTTANPLVNSAGTYTVVVTNSVNGCTSTATVSVTNNTTLPNVTPGAAATLTCTTLQYSISANSTTPNATYNWSGFGIVSNGNTSSPTVNAAGTYTVTVTDPVNGCTSTASVLVNRDLNSPDAVSGTPLILTCAATSGIITASSGTANVSYAWVGPNIIANGTTSAPTVNAAGTYTVTITDPVNGCTNTTTVLVSLDNSIPNVTATPSLTLTCTTTADTLFANSTTLGVTYNWVGPGIVMNGATASPTVNAPGTYTVTVTNPTTGCTNTTTALVNLDNSIPNVTATASLTLTCVTTSDTIFANSTTSGVNYNWSGPGTILNGTTASPTINAPGTYTVTVTNPVSGCTNTTTVLVNTNLALPELNTTSPVILNCAVTSDTLNATSSVAGVTYSWNGPGIVSGATTSSPIINAPGTYVVTITDPINGCTNTNTVTVNNNIAHPNVTAGSTVTLTCTTTSAAINATSTVPNASFNWSGPNIVSGVNTSAPVVNGVGTYIVTSTDPANGCTNTASVTVNNNITLPNVTAGPQLIFTCLISSSTIGASTSVPNPIYNWSGPGIVANGTTANPTVNVAGTYTVTVTDPINGCTSTTTVTAVTAPPVVASANAAITTITLGANTTLNASGGLTYLWTPSNGLSCTTCDAPIASPTETTTYCVLVTDQYGCTDSSCVTIKVFDPCSADDKDLELPNVFSPNGDNVNDLFFIKDWNNECVVEFSIEVFNRWGMKMFESGGTTVHWDGRTMSGLESPDGTYFYIIRIRKTKGDAKTYKGSFTLVR